MMCARGLSHVNVNIMFHRNKYTDLKGGCVGVAADRRMSKYACYRTQNADFYETVPKVPDLIFARGVDL